MTNLDVSLKDWRQGDFALDVGGFVFATPKTGSGQFEFEVGYETENIVGWVVISQTCDIIRCTGDRFYVAVSPLITINEQDISAVSRGRRPYLTEIENTDANVFADLRRFMSVDKRLMSTWERRSGFTTSDKRQRFAAALERKFGQFAFPDEFDEAVKDFRQRVWSRHSKSESEPGRVYRSLMQIRFLAEPNWTASLRKISVIAIMKDEIEQEVDRHKIAEELKNSLEKIQWPYGYEWRNNRLILGTTSELTAGDVIFSQRGDFDFLCY